MYKVLLVDDDRLILRGLTSIVRWEEMGCEVVATAMDGREGIRLIREKQPDILLTDIRMPNMDGLTMAAAVRSEFPNMQMAVLTAFRDFDYAQQAIRLGVCRYMLKPSNLEELRDAVLEMVRRLHRGEESRLSDRENAEDRAAHSYVVSHAIAWMRAHSAEHITLEDVAAQVFVSQWHLSKLINRETGIGFLDLLSRMRIDRAKELLSDPANRIGDVAYQVGFSDVAHFSKSFKKVTGQTPGEFRNHLPR